MSQIPPATVMIASPACDAAHLSAQECPVSHLIDIYLQPGKAFAGLKERPSFLLPLALSLVLSGAMTFLYFKNVDYDWYLCLLYTSRCV